MCFNFTLHYWLGMLPLTWQHAKMKGTNQWWQPLVIITNEMTKIVNCIEGGSSRKPLPTTARLLRLASFYDSDDSAAEKPTTRSATESAAASVSTRSPARPAASPPSAAEPPLPWPSPAPLAPFSESTRTRLGSSPRVPTTASTRHRSRRSCPSRNSASHENLRHRDRLSLDVRRIRVRHRRRDWDGPRCCARSGSVLFDWCVMPFSPSPFVRCSASTTKKRFWLAFYVSRFTKF